MYTERLTSADKRRIAAVILVAAACIGYVVLNYSAAFPEASIDLRYSKAQITGMAERVLRRQALSPEGFRNLTLFDSDETARTYLEREAGLEEANRLMSGPVSVWRWRARWFRPPDKEERVVWLSPTGRLVGLEHIIREDAPGARLGKEAARQLAQAFLQEQSRKPHRLVEEQLVERPRRYDFVFTWEQEDFRIKEARYRRTIEVHGDRIGRYSEYLYVPEAWKRDFAALRSRNLLYSQIAQAAGVLLILAAVAALIPAFRQGRIRWRPLLLIVGAVAGLMVTNEWNSISFAIDGMPTSSPYHQSVIFALLAGLGAGIGVFFYVIVAAAAGEPLYRDSQPRGVSLLALTDRRIVRTREFFLATVAGYGFAAVHIAYVVAFYLIGRRFGVWSPQDVNYSDFLSTSFPWIYPLAVSLLASTSEEFWFRLLAIPLLKRWLRSTWLAVLIPAFVWGFLHSNYPQQPGYIRGLEVGVIGVAAGFLMLRFGIFATLIWHYTVDAVLIGMFLIRSDSFSFQVSGWLVASAVMFPLVISLVLYRKHGGFVTAPELLNESATWDRAVAARRETAEPPPGVALVPRWNAKWFYVGAVVAGAAGLALNAPRFGDFIRVRLSRADAERLASHALATQVDEAGGWRHVTEFLPNLSAVDFEYVRRLAGETAATNAVREHTDAGLWRVRFLRPLRKEEWRVSITQDARILSVEQVLDEKAPGANLDSEAAREVAERYLVRDKNLPLGRFRLVDSSSDKRERRTDHAFVWEDTAYRIGETRARISLDVVGDRPSAFERFLKLPEQWVREFERPRLTGIVVPATAGAAGFLLLVIFVRRLGRRDEAGRPVHRSHWKVYLAVAGSAAVVAGVSSLNNWPKLLARYDTAEPLESHIAQVVLGWLMRSLLLGLLCFLAALAADVFLQAATGDRRLRKPSLTRAVAVLGALWGVGRVLGAIGWRVPGPRFSLSLWTLPGVDSAIPALDALCSSVLGAVALVSVGTIVVAAVCTHFGTWRRWALTIGIASVYAAAHAHNVPQFVWQFGSVLAVAGVVTALALVCAADLITFAVASFWLLAAAPVVTMIEQPAAFLRENGVAAAVVAGMIGIVAIHSFNQRYQGG